jgi:hypothetical protein
MFSVLLSGGWTSLIASITARILKKMVKTYSFNRLDAKHQMLLLQESS